MLGKFTVCTHPFTGVRFVLYDGDLYSYDQFKALHPDFDKDMKVDEISDRAGLNKHVNELFDKLPLPIK